MVRRRHDLHGLPVIGRERLFPRREEVAGQGDLFRLKGDGKLDKCWPETGDALGDKAMPAESVQIARPPRRQRERQGNGLKHARLTTPIVAKQRR
jgi:hypothetical protein